MPAATINVIATQRAIRMFARAALLPIDMSPPHDSSLGGAVAQVGHLPMSFGVTITLHFGQRNCCVRRSGADFSVGPMRSGCDGSVLRGGTGGALSRRASAPLLAASAGVLKVATAASSTGRDRVAGGSGR